MDFDLTEEQKKLKRNARDYLEREIIPREKGARFPRQIVMTVDI